MLLGRGGPEATGPIYAALAILKPGMPVEVRLNEEVEMVARAKVDALRRTWRARDGRQPG